MTPGIHQITMREYLSLKALSSGLCNTLLQYSPFHAKHEQDGGPSDDSEASDMGTAIHDCLLEGRDRIVSIDAADWRTKAAKEARDLARSQGGIPMLAHKVSQVEAAVKAAKEFVAGSEIAGVFDSGKPEQTVIWKEGDILCKARADWLSDSWHISVKTTTGSANPKHYTRFTVSQQGHDTGLAFYRRGMEALGIEVEHRILLIEQDALGVCCFGLAPSKLEYANGRIDRAISIWQQCQKSGVYPAYPTQTCFAEAQPWELASEQEEQMNVAYDSIQERNGLQP